MKKIIAIVTAVTMMHVAFSQTVTSGKTDKQAQLGATGAHFVKANPGYMSSRGPVETHKKATTSVAQTNTSPAASALASPAPKQATVATPQQAKLSNEQRTANLNTHLAQKKAQEDANKASAARPASSARPTTTLKKPIGLKNKPNTQTTTATKAVAK